MSTLQTIADASRIRTNVHAFPSRERVHARTGEVIVDGKYYGVHTSYEDAFVEWNYTFCDRLYLPRKEHFKLLGGGQVSNLLEGIVPLKLNKYVYWDPRPHLHGFGFAAIHNLHGFTSSMLLEVLLFSLTSLPS